MFDFESECILCGNEANGYLFCRKCYYKYKDTDFYLKFSECEPDERHIILASELEARTAKRKKETSSLGFECRCEDGHWVRSHAERDIDNFLYRHGIIHAYEPVLETDGKPIHPDFYLPELDVYIEHHGLEGRPRYDAMNAYKEPFFKGKLIVTTREDLRDIETSLTTKLGIKRKR